MLEINGTLIIAMISFIIFGFIMNAVLYQPVLKIMQEREAFLLSNEQETAEAIRQAEELLTKKENELLQARIAAQKSVAEGTEKFKNANKAVINEFSNEQKLMAEREKEKIQQEFLSAKEQLQSEQQELSDIILQKIIGEGVKNV